MRLHRNTVILFFLATFLFVVNLLLQDDGSFSSQKELPSIPAISKDEVQRIEITHKGEKIVMEKKEDWEIVYPNSEKADVSRVNSLLLNFRKSIDMDIDARYIHNRVPS